MLGTNRAPVVYPDSDGEPMSDNTLQYDWIVTLQGNLDRLLPDHFVAGDLLWYPVEGRPNLRQAPDVLVALGRAKGHRGRYGRGGTGCSSRSNTTARGAASAFPCA